MFSLGQAKFLITACIYYNSAASTFIIALLMCHALLFARDSEMFYSSCDLRFCTGQSATAGTPGVKAPNGTIAYIHKLVITVIKIK